MEERLEPNLELGLNPCCGYLTDSVDSLPDFKDELPNLGDVSVCLNCGTLLVYTKAGTANLTRLATRKDIEPFNAKQRRILRKVQKIIFRRGRFRPGPSSN